MPRHYLHGSLTEKFETDPEFRRLELRVRELEKELNLLRPQVEELETRLSALDGAGNDRGAARVRMELDQQRQKLQETRGLLEEAWAARNALLAKQQ